MPKETTPWIVSSGIYNVFLDEASATITTLAKLIQEQQQALLLGVLNDSIQHRGFFVTWAEGDSDFDKVWDDRALIAIPNMAIIYHHD